MVLKAPPGAGKTTGVPPALFADTPAGKILLIQPRRLAARSAASRLASLVNCKLGDEVGYQVRFDRRSSKSTRILVVTPGIALRQLQSDPFLEDVSCVVLDEFHERSLEMDLLLGMVHRIRTTVRPELNLIVMSATLDPGPIVDFLGDAEAVMSEGRSYPVDIAHVAHHSDAPLEQRMLDAIRELAEKTSGHLLGFLPGVGEIRRTHAIVESALGDDFDVHDLYGDLSPKDQDDVLGPSDRRKIILSTNVAETSVTIEGVTGVIDSGLARVLRFDASVGLPKLSLESISQASAEQRAGRAGRTQAGRCLRLWPANVHRSRPERDTAEIERADFCAAALRLFAWGERDISDFPWLTAPRVSAVDRATKLLQQLHAIDSERSVTELGRSMLSIPVHPRVARFLLSAADQGIVDDAAIAAALLTERSPFRRDRRRDSQTLSACDVSDRVDRLKAFFEGDRGGDIEPAFAKQIRRVADQLLRSINAKGVDHGAKLSRALLSAFPDRVARRREPSSDKGVMVGGRGVRIDRNSSVRDSELFVCVDVDSGDTDARVRLATAVERHWLDEGLIREVDEPIFQPESQSVIARHRTYYDDLLLSETPIRCAPGGEIAEMLVEAAKQQMDQVFPSDDQQLEGFIQRVRFLSAVMTELELPSTQQLVDDALVALCQSRTSFAQLRKAPWLDHIRSGYDYETLQTIDRLAPEKMRVPSGNSIRLQYADGKPPIMEVRIQELFGWNENPRIAGGRVPVQLHLLGPNYRAQQITEDLQNFWSSTYIQVRKDLRRRYPKHHWPEDPTAATATHNGLKPRN